VTRTQWSGGGVSGQVNRTYDDDLRLRTIAVNGASAVTYSYDPDSLLTQAGSLALARDAETGLLTGTTLGSVTTSYTYNGFGELASMTARHGATTLYSEIYTRDRLGRIVTRVETVQGVTTTYGYGYDDAGRLETVETNGLPTAEYFYDLNGNRLEKRTLAGSELGSYDDQDRMLTYGDASFAYTANGELLTKTDTSGTTSYDYDVFGNLLGVDLPNGTQIDYKVDARNRRIERRVNGVVTQRLLWQGQLSPIAELNASNTVVSRFVYATRVNVPDFIVKAGVTYRVLTDHLGSPRLIVNASTGAIAQRMSYDEWGVVTQDTSPGFQPFGFAGGVYDGATGLVRFGARDLFALAGKWTSTDPASFAGGDPNTHAYVSNDPMNWIDPSGLWTGGNHDKILDRAFGGCLTSAEIDILKSASEYVDRDQSLEGSFKHAMRAPEQSIEAAQQQWSDYVAGQLSAAQGLASRGAQLFALGTGMHALMDNTSPSHEGFQVWNGMNYIDPRVWRHGIGDASLSDTQAEKTAEILRRYYNSLGNGNHCGCD